MKNKTSKLTVGIDVTWANIENKSGGVFQYAINLITALVEYTDINVVAIIERTGGGIFDYLKGRKNFRTVIPESSWLFMKVIKSEKIDVVHIPIQFFCDFTLSVPMVSTLHDLQHYYYPEFFTQEEIQFRNTYYKKSAEFSERVIVSFDHVKNDIIKFYNISPEKVDICPFGMAKPNPINLRSFPEVREKYQLPEEYLYYPANAWPHKNHIGLIKALKLLYKQNGFRIPLICSGQKLDDYYPEIKRLVDEFSLGDFVNFIGYIPEEDKNLILKNSTLVVIPTLYEAGSLPLIEAMAYEVPVICSNVTSLPDTIKDPRFTFDPNNIEQISEKIALMLKNKKLREENRENSKKRIKEWDWGNAANGFVESYSRAVEEFNKISETSYFSDWSLNYEFFAVKEIESLKKNLEASEADRAARLEVINKLQQKCETSEADRAIKLEVINGLLEKVNKLSDPRHALKTILVFLLRKTHLFTFYARCGVFFNRLYHFLRRT